MGRQEIPHAATPGAVRSVMLTDDDSRPICVIEYDAEGNEVKRHYAEGTPLVD